MLLSISIKGTPGEGFGYWGLNIYAPKVFGFLPSLNHCQVPTFIFPMMFPSKRPSPDEGDERCESMVPEPKRRATLENAVRSIMGFGGLSLNRIVLNLEPMLRSWQRTF
ncbi:hypothetical protein GOBAR_AA19929 [Gossypium barbadense]|uniref:Uncharacterized protein n=1 Tax=Gossypium barbadense TaxID=3634 RepID=A0A2P5XBL2_GOSBA|nr:hypothetical protein GOBAR_AA19929 [Gossypium barbadense]